MHKHSSNKLFLSAVTREFGSYRTDLVRRLTRPNVDVKVQEDFVVTGDTTLQKLDLYIQHCSAIIHLVGDATGAIPNASEVRSIVARYPDLPEKLPVLAELLKQSDPGISYTQWEVYLAIYHHRHVFIYRPTEHAPRDKTYQPNLVEQTAQALHYDRICALGRDRGQFDDVKDLSSHVMRDLLDILAGDHSQKPSVGSQLGTAWRKFFGPFDRWMHKVHRAIHPLSAEPLSSENLFYWSVLALRVFAVMLTIVVLWQFYYQIEKGSLHGIQQGIFLGVAFFVNLFLLGWRRLPQRAKRLVRLGSNEGWKAKPWKFAAHAIDLALLPLELTCVIATIPISAERWLKGKGGEELNVRIFQLALFVFAIVLIQVARYWPIYRHACRSLFRGQPPVFALLINWLLAGWFLFNPLLLPTGATATFQMSGGHVLQVSADSTTDEIAIASFGTHVSPNFPLATTIQIVDSSSLQFKSASFEYVPWEGNDLKQMVFYDRRITVVRESFVGSAIEHQFLAWNRNEIWGKPSVVPNLPDFNLQDTRLDATGAVIITGYKVVPGAAKSPTVREMILNQRTDKAGQESNAPTAVHAVPAVAIAAAPGQDIRWVESPWLDRLSSIHRVDLSRDGKFLVVTGFLPSPEENINPYLDQRMYTTALLETNSGNIVWEKSPENQTTSLFHDSPGDKELRFSPDGQRILKSIDAGMITLSNSTTYQLLNASTGDTTISFSADAGDMIWSPDSTHLALRCEQRIEIYNAVNTALVKTFYVPRGSYTCHAFTRDGKHLAAGGDQGTLWLYEVPAE